MLHKITRRLKKFGKRFRFAHYRFESINLPRDQYPHTVVIHTKGSGNRSVQPSTHPSILSSLFTAGNPSISAAVPLCTEWPLDNGGVERASGFHQPLFLPPPTPYPWQGRVVVLVIFTTLPGMDERRLRTRVLQFNLHSRTEATTRVSFRPRARNLVYEHV